MALKKTSYASFSTVLTEVDSTTYSNAPFDPQVGKRKLNNKKGPPVPHVILSKRKC